MEKSVTQKIISFIARYWLILIGGILALACQHDALAYYWQTWNQKDSYYSHGPLVPILACLMVWQNKDRLRGATTRGSWWGVPLIVMGLGLYVTGLGFGWEPLFALAFFCFIYGAILSLLGLRIAGIVFLPVLFLATMIPLPNAALDNATGKYSLASSVLAAKLLQLSGHAVERTGNILTSSSLPGPLIVGGACSGLKLLIALVMSACFLAYVLEGARWKKTVLILMALPLSILVNSIRIILLAYVGFWTHSVGAVNSFHDISGYIALAVCVTIVLGAARLIGIRYFRTFPPAEISQVKPPRASTPGIVAVAVLVVTLLAGSLVGGLYELPQGHLDRANYPASFGRWSSQEAEIDKVTREALSKGDLLSRVYYDKLDTGRRAYLFLDASYDLSAFHNPHICLPGSGVRIVGEKAITLPVHHPKRADIRATALTTRDKYGSGVVIYWYSFGDQSFPTSKELLAFTHASRLNDLKTIALDPFSFRKVREDISSRQIVWYRFSAYLKDDAMDQHDLERFIVDFVAQQLWAKHLRL